MAQQSDENSKANRDDVETIAALRAGDEPTFRRLCERTGPMMRRLARSCVDSDAVAEEVVQETWLAVVNGIDRFEGRSSLETWMVSILVNRARTHAARERRSLPFSSIDASDEAPAPAMEDRFREDDHAWAGYWCKPPRPWQKPERRLLALEARDYLRAALAALPERQRVVVSLRDVEGWSAREICEALDISAENQRVLLHRGRSSLRLALESYLDEREGS